MQLAVQTMSVEDKLAALELLWESLRERPENVPVPAWQHAVLQEREARIASGASPLVPWEEAKARLDGSEA